MHSNDRPPTEFVTLFAAQARRLYAFIYTQLGRETDTDDVFQETSRVLWEKFDQFESGTSFAAWSRRVAEFQVLAWRQRQQRSRLQFSDEFVRLVAAEAVEQSEVLEARHRALAHCVDQLADRERELLRLRYSAGATTKSVAERLGRSVDAVYKALNRLQQRLEECARRALAAQSDAGPVG